MPSELAETERRILLPPMNDIRTCGQLKARLAECLNDGGALFLDAGAFESGDVTFVQLLVSTLRTAAGLNRSVSVVNAGPAFLALLDRCGLDADRLCLCSREQ